MPAIHTHNLDQSDPYFILAVVDTLDNGYSALSEESELSQDSARKLAEICDSVTAILPEFEGDLGDFAADLDEIL